MTAYRYVLVDDPAPLVRRITLNRPDKRNALNNVLRAEIFDALHRADRDDSVRVSVIRGAGPCFSAGYDLGADNRVEQPYFTAGGDATWPRHVVQGWFEIWDLAKPVIAQVHGYCLAGGSELATACDLVYVADDAQIGYPPVRLMSPPDMQFHPWLLGLRNAMELMLTGDALSGTEAVRMGFANRAFSAAELDQRVLAIAERVAKIPTDLQQINKRSVHRAMEIMGMRAAIRAGTELQALAFHQRSSLEYRAELKAGVTQALTKRDRQFGDYRGREPLAPPKTVLLVCQANTCRSVMAQVLLETMLAERDAQRRIRVRSGGIGTYARDGMLPSLDARLMLREDGIHLAEDAMTSTDLRQHREIIAGADLILTMTAQQREALAAFEEARGRPVFTLREFGGETGDIVDPVMKGEEAFRACRDEIRRCLERSIDRLLQVLA